MDRDKFRGDIFSKIFVRLIHGMHQQLECVLDFGLLCTKFCAFVLNTLERVGSSIAANLTVLFSNNPLILDTFVDVVVVRIGV
jgi:hypothetical protein